MSREKYFNTLNYTLGNEDTSLELALLPENANHVFSVAGSGGRVLPLLAKYPKLVTCVDVVAEQLYLTELRLESARALNYQEFLSFWGYPPTQAAPEDRQSLFSRIKLSKPAKEFWLSYFGSNQWESILYQGKWEKTFAKLSRINRRIIGSKGSRLFEITNSSEYFEYLKNTFPRKTWSALVRMLGNATVFNAMLYRGSFPVKNMPGSMHNFYMGAFGRLFKQGLARENFFLQLLFFGEIRFSEGSPIECDPNVFAKAKRGLAKAEINYIHGDLIKAARQAETPIEFLSFSDVPSYFQGEVEKTFLQDISSDLAPNALVVIRNYLRTPEGTDLSGYENATEDYREIIDQEKVQMYSIDIFRRKS